MAGKMIIEGDQTGSTAYYGWVITRLERPKVAAEAKCCGRINPKKD